MPRKIRKEEITISIIKYKFKLMDAFPSDSVLARWIFALSSVVNDLLSVNSLMVQSFDQQLDGLEETKEMGERMYYFKLACSHFNEAMKVLRNGDEEQSVKDFLNELFIKDIDAFDTITCCKESWGEGFLREVVKPIRDATFHYHYNDLANVLQAIYSDTPTSTLF